MTTKKQKISLIIIILVINILLLEISLRLAGFIYKTYRIDNKKITLEEDRGIIKILCLGDSFTFGAGAPKGYAYPEQLEKLLNKNSSLRKFIVYNGGVPGSNSSMLYKKLQKDIVIYTPDIIVVMTGCNNNSNFQDSNYFLFMDNGLRSYLYRLDAFLTHARSYKIFKTCFVN